MMEDLGESSGATTGSLAADNGAAVGIRLQRLGDYRILREIGRGGMGVVYEAEQEIARPPGGPEGALGRLAARPQAGAPVRARGEGGGAAAPHQHRAGLRRGPAGRASLFRDAVHRRAGARRGAGGPAAAAAGEVRGEVRPRAEGRAGRRAVGGRRGPLADHRPVRRRWAAGRRVGDRALRRRGPGRRRRERPPGRHDSSSAVLPGSSELSASSDPDRQFYRSVARIGIQVAEALEYANRQGILHRDVKPSNLLLDNHGNVWVADFGLAKTAEADDLTHTGDILGTIRYMAPERFSGHCDARSDVYSLGLTLYELVALRPAYEASDRHTLIERVLHEEPERLRKLAPGVPRDLETIIAKATARDPAGRYATAAALAEDLRRFVEDRPIRARRISAAERLARWCRRNPVARQRRSGVAALALVAVLSCWPCVHARRGKLEANERIARLASNLENESWPRPRAGPAPGRVEQPAGEARSRARPGRLREGQIGVGMLWTVESLRMATEAGDEAGRHVALANLSAWRRHLVELKGVFSHGDT